MERTLQRTPFARFGHASPAPAIFRRSLAVAGPEPRLPRRRGGARRSFEWNSESPAAGISPEDRRLRRCDDGALARGLEAQPRVEDTERQVVVWPRHDPSPLGPLPGRRLRCCPIAPRLRAKAQRRRTQPPPRLRPQRAGRRYPADGADGAVTVCGRRRSVAEVSLLGGLGCGRQLVALAAEDLLAQGGVEYLVLQVGHGLE